MKNTKKVLLGGVAALALVGTSVFGTYMYLTSKTETVTNTFTVGNVKITLDEKNVDGSKDDQGNTPDRDTKNTYANILPGHTYVKDPIVHVIKNSEDCYLFVEVNNQFSIESGHVAADTDKGIKEYKTIAEQMSANGWTTVNGGNVYYYKSMVTKNTEMDFDVPVFGEFRVADSVENSAAAGNITVKAYAVQADGFTNAVDAWNAAFVTKN